MSSRRRTVSYALLAVPLLALPLSARAQASKGTVKETVHLVITGGANAGTYDSKTSSGGCSAGATGPGSFGNQLSSSEADPKKFNSLQLIVDDAKAAAGGTKEFLITFGFGSLMHRSAEYEVDTRSSAGGKKGSGTVTINDKGSTATVNFDVTTPDGVHVVGTIDCKSVVRMG